jgi:hypothetical protein
MSSSRQGLSGLWAAPAALSFLRPKDVGGGIGDRTAQNLRRVLGPTLRHRRVTI